MAGQRIEGSSLHIAVASPDDPRIDEFHFGDEVWEAEVAAEFKSRIWEEKRDMFLFSLDDHTLVAGARMGFRNIAHPHRDSTEGRAKYFLVLSFGVNARFQGEPDGVDRSRSYAKVILDEIERRAREKPECVGLSLHVRVANEKARHVYEKRGFEYEGPSFIEDEQDTLEMRKVFYAMSPGRCDRGSC